MSSVPTPPSAFERDVARFAGKIFDVLVIGGGINGLGIAWDAALRGYSVALVERSDFGGETSAACFKIIHGGLRYLQHLDLTRLHRSVREQRILRSIAPHLTQPLPFLLPCYGYGKKGKELLNAGLTLYDYLSKERNTGVSSEQVLPEKKFYSKAELLKIAPGIPQAGLRGGYTFHDAQVRHCERLTLAVAKAAHSAGAVLCNYTEFLRRGAGRSGLFIVRDQISGKELEISARSVVNAAGPWGKQVSVALGFPEKRKPRAYVRGLQLVLPEILSRYSLAVESSSTDQSSVISRGGRSYFLVPWEGCTLAGTSEAVTSGTTDERAPSMQQIQEFLTELRTAYSSDALQLAQVRSVFGGLIPLESNAEAGRYRVLRDDQIEVEKSSVPTVEVCGVKYTTFRRFSEEVVDRLEAELGEKRAASRTASTRLPGADVTIKSELYREWIALGLAPEQFGRVWSTYGSESQGLLEHVRQDPGVGQPVFTSLDLLRVELRYAVRNEMAIALTDVLFRRTSLAARGELNRGLLGVLAEEMGGERGWTRQEIAAEVHKAEHALQSAFSRSFNLQ